MTVYYYPQCVPDLWSAATNTCLTKLLTTLTSCLKDVKVPDNSVLKNQVEEYGNLSSA